MTLKKQLRTLKENWLLALGIFILVLIPLLSNPTTSLFKGGMGYGLGFPMMDSSYQAEEMARSVSSYYPGDSGFAPDVEVRKITKTASLSTEIDRNKFHDAEIKLKGLITSTDSILINENVNQYGKGITSYLYGYYEIKVETTKYDAVVAQLKDFGTIQSFNENSLDITGSYTTLEDQLETEKSRLQRYKQLYSEVKEISDKIELEDRIFNQERTIKYLEDALSNKDLQIEYSTIYFTMTEEQSKYTNIAVIKLSELVRKLVNSFNSILSLLFWAVPWAIAGILIWLGYRKVKQK